MVTPLASRFAVLPVDDDGDTSRRITAKSLKKREEQQQKSQSSGGTNKKQVPDAKKKQNSKKKSEQSLPDNKKPKAKAEGIKKKTTQEQQWEQWKQKDAEFVDGNYEEDLHQAILESKLDYEEKKEYYDQIKKASEEEKKAGTKKNKKSNKTPTMTLSQFNQMSENRNQVDANGVNEKSNAIANGIAKEHDPKFFEKVKSEAKKALHLEQAEEQRKAREPLIDEMISAARYEDRLEKCNERIAKLEEENKELRKRLKNVQERNTTFLQLLSQGEKDITSEHLLSIPLEELMRRVEKELVHQLEEKREIVARNKALSIRLMYWIDNYERQGFSSLGSGRFKENKGRTKQ